MSLGEGMFWPRRPKIRTVGKLQPKVEEMGVGYFKKRGGWGFNSVEGKPH